MKTLILAALASLATLSPAIAQMAEGSYDGTWDFTEEGCANEYSDGRLIVDGNILRFWESSCTLTNPTGVRGLPHATVYDAACSGEGNSWNTTFLLSAYGAQGGYLLVHQDQGATIRMACNWPNGGATTPSK